MSKDTERGALNFDRGTCELCCNPGFESVLEGRIVALCKPIHYGVDVRRNVQAEMDEVVAGIHRHQQIGRRQAHGESMRELRTPDAAGKRQYHDVPSR